MCSSNFVIDVFFKMKRIKFYMLHPAAKDAVSALKYLQIESLQKDFDFEWDSTNPDYLVTTELIYNVPSVRKKYRKLYKKARITIFFTREAVTPDFNLCDYAIGFDSDLQKGGDRSRYVQLPTAFDLYSAFTSDKKNAIDSIDKAAFELRNKKFFCNFLYSNHLAHPNRDRLFYLISRYKRVDSLGRHLNNVDIRGTGYKGHERDCVAIKNRYKFSIAAENAEFPGYTSEKILTSLAAHTVPIYFGDPDIEKFINPECFINCNNMNSLEEVIDVVRKIDDNDDLWCKMISTPWQTPAQIEYSAKRVTDYKDFFYKIFDLDIGLARRIPIGCRPDMYKYQFFSERIHKVPLMVRAYQRIFKSYIK